MSAGPDPTWVLRLDPDLDPRTRPDGLRVAVKDCIEVAGTPLGAGSPVVAEQAVPATADAPCLDGFREAGARIVGKTGLHELCFGGTGVNPHLGTPENPLDPRRVPGGSSSGSAVAVARGEADVALGTDTAGSIRTPAACCGVVGLKTTWGAVPVEGTRPLAPSLDTVGLLARDVATLAAGATLLDPALTSGEVAASPTIGRFRVEGTDPTVDAAIDAALLEAGYLPIEVELPGWAAANEAAIIVLFGEALVINDDLWRHHRGRLGADLVERFTLAEAISPAEVGEARARREPWRLELADVLGSVGVLALPTMRGYAPRLTDAPVAPNPACPPVNLAGHPAIALPVPSGGLLPASLQLVAPDHHELRLIATAAVIEGAIRSSR
ncbi:MAG TPA: amidase [Aquihabitans sp.]|nr:amidase [Aquihabitans sp.]